MQPFGPWLPDISSFSPEVATEALNVVPSQTGYDPFQSLAPVTTALTARAQGAISVRGLSGGVSNFSGDATKLYLLNSSNTVWNDASRIAGGPYATAGDGWWSFTPFGDFVIACNQADDTQVFQLSVSTNFSALAGSPPRAAIVGTIRDFIVLARLSSNFNRIQWSGINDSTAWTPSATTMADYNDFPDGGVITGFVGGEFGLVFQERAIQRMQFEGPPTIFRFDKISNALGCRVERSIASYDNLVFFLSHDGFYMVRGGSEVVGIGTDKVDKYINTNLNASYYDRCSAAIDPGRKIYIFSFPSSASAGTPDSVMIYHWPTGKWTHAAFDHELLFAAATQASVTIDGMDAYAGTIDALPAPVDSLFWAGSGKIALSGFDAAHKSGFFTGPALTATIETGDVQFNAGRKTMLRGTRPMIETCNAAPAVSVGYRDRLQDSVAYRPAVEINANGVSRCRVNARYHRARVTIPGGALWTRAIGIDDPQISVMGAR